MSEICPHGVSEPHICLACDNPEKRIAELEAENERLRKTIDDARHPDGSPDLDDALVKIEAALAQAERERDNVIHNYIRLANDAPELADPLRKRDEAREALLCALVRKRDEAREALLEQELRRAAQDICTRSIDD